MGKRHGAQPPARREAPTQLWLRLRRGVHAAAPNAIPKHALQDRESKTRRTPYQVPCNPSDHVPRNPVWQHNMKQTSRLGRLSRQYEH